MRNADKLQQSGWQSQLESIGVSNNKLTDILVSPSDTVRKVKLENNLLDCSIVENVKAAYPRASVESDCR